MKDPYLKNNFAFKRLWNEYEKYKKLVIALDWDDTVFDYHNKGFTYPKIIELFKECQELGFYIVVFTGTPKEKWDNIRERAKEMGINVTSINENAFPMPFGNDGKIYYNILIDDRAGLPSTYKILRKVVDKAKQNKDSKS